MIRAELTKLTRPRMLTMTALTVLVLAVLGAVVGLLGAEASPPGAIDAGGGLTRASLEQASGGTAAFTLTLGYMSIVLIALFVASVAGEFQRGTFRTLLLQQPRRGRVLAGKVAALVVFVGGALAVALVISWIISMIVASTQGVETGAWVSFDGLADAMADYGRAILYVAGIAVLATMVGVLARSVAIGIGAALLWTGPLENILGDDWAPAAEVFPGLLLRAMLNPESTGIAAGQILMTLTLYLLTAVAVTAVVLRRRDVTG